MGSFLIWNMWWYAVESQMTLRRNISPPSSGSNNNKPNMIPPWKEQQRELCFSLTWKFLNRSRENLKTLHREECVATFGISVKWLYTNEMSPCAVSPCVVTGHYRRCHFISFHFISIKWLSREWDSSQDRTNKAVPLSVAVPADKSRPLNEDRQRAEWLHSIKSAVSATSSRQFGMCWRRG
jgi:hypothetical protein